MDPFLAAQRKTQHDTPDPFFAAHKRFKTGNMPMYTESIARYRPKEANPMYERALAFRQREKESIQALVEEHEQLKKKYSRACQYIVRSARNSKLSADATTNRSSDSSAARVQDAEPRSEEGEGGAGSVQPEVLPSALPDLRGQSSEHDSEGRPPSSVERDDAGPGTESSPREDAVDAGEGGA